MAEFLKQYEIFLRKAKVDLKAAQCLFENFETGEAELDLEIICFHLQQSAEKFLKAILSFYEIDFPKVHDLETLIKLIEIHHIPIQIDRKILVDLTDFAVEGRYSIILDDIGDTGQYFKTIEQMRVDIINLLANPNKI